MRARITTEAEQTVAAESPSSEPKFQPHGSGQRPPYQTGRRRAPRPWPAWLRVLLSIVVVVAFFKVYAGWHWSKRVGSGPGVTFSPTKSYVGFSSTMALFVQVSAEKLERLPAWLHRVWPMGYWHLAYTLATVLPASLIGVIAYAVLTRRFGRPHADRHSRCRRCAYILYGLTRPRCPECGEPI